MPNAEAVRVALSASVRVAPVGTTAPVDATAAFAAGWLDLGYTGDDGFNIGRSRDIESIMAHQTMYPVRRVVTSMDLTVGATLREWNTEAVKFALSGVLSTPDNVGSPNEHKFVPNAPENLDERAMAVEWKDGAKTNRLIIPKGMITEMGDVNLARSSAADLPFTFGLIATSGVDPWYILTNDANLAPA